MFNNAVATNNTGLAHFNPTQPPPTSGHAQLNSAETMGREAWGPPNSDGEESNSSSYAGDTEEPRTPLFGPPPNSGRGKKQKIGMGMSQFANTATPPEQAIINGRIVSLHIVRQPEEQHRARYMSEGSRGAVKGKFGKGHCTIQLHGYNRPTRVEIYAATEQEPMSPHPLYRLIPVTGKGGGTQTTPCEEIITSGGFSAVSVLLRPEFKMTAVLDCIGILKICSHDTKRRLPKAGKNTSIQLVFRTVIGQANAEDITIQTLSSPISCTQQLGYPEVQKVSATSTTVRGGDELFILGKNFDKNIRAVFREYDSEGNLVWISDGNLDKKYSHQCHLVCIVPTYRNLNITDPVEVTITLECGKKTGHPQTFTYYPEKQASGSPTLAESSSYYSSSDSGKTATESVEKWVGTQNRTQAASGGVEEMKAFGEQQQQAQAVQFYPAVVSEFLTPSTVPPLSSIVQILDPVQTTTTVAPICEFPGFNTATPIMNPFTPIAAPAYPTVVQLQPVAQHLDHHHQLQTPGSDATSSAQKAYSGFDNSEVITQQSDNPSNIQTSTTDYSYSGVICGDGPSAKRLKPHVSEEYPATQWT